MRTMVLSSLFCENILATAFLEIGLFTFESLPSISGIRYDSAGIDFTNEGITSSLSVSGSLYSMNSSKELLHEILHLQ